MLAQLVEHCTGIAEVMGSNPVQAWIFFKPSFHYYLSSVITAKIAFIHECEDDNDNSNLNNFIQAAM